MPWSIHPIAPHLAPPVPGVWGGALFVVLRSGVVLAERCGLVERGRDRVQFRARVPATFQRVTASVAKAASAGARLWVRTRVTASEPGALSGVARAYWIV